MSEIKICANKAPYKVEPSHSLENFAEARKLESLLAKEAYLKIEIDRLEKELLSRKLPKVLALSGVVDN